MKEHFNFHSALPLHLAAIKPKQADFCLSVFKILQEKLNISRKELQNISFLLAISGGVDSVAMLAIFKACQQYFGYTLHVAHFNHGIREESAAEEKLVQKNFESPCPEPFVQPCPCRFCRSFAAAK